MHSLLIFLSVPLSLFWLILLAGLLFYILKRKRAGLFSVFFSIVWLAMISFPFIPEILVKSLEKRYPPLLEISQFNLEDTVNILVLGGGFINNINLPPNDQLSLNSLARLTEAIRLHRLLNASLLILTGSEPVEKVSESNLFVQAAFALGVKGNEIRFIGNPENTQMEALDYTKKYGTNKPLILVTDAVHMPRAMFLFEKAGQSPIASPTNHLVKSDWENGVSYWLPASSNIAMMESAMHEIVGLLYARLFYRGISDEIKK